MDKKTMTILAKLMKAMANKMDNSDMGDDPANGWWKQGYVVALQDLSSAIESGLVYSVLERYGISTKGEKS